MVKINPLPLNSELLVALDSLTSEVCCVIMLAGQIGGEIVPIGKDMERLQFTATHRVMDRLKRLAADAGMTKSAYVTMLINKNWKEEGHTDAADEFLSV